MPEAREVEIGTLVSSLPKVNCKNFIFAGWYYDEAATLLAAGNDPINESKTLYADMIETEPESIVDTPIFVSEMVDAENVDSYSFTIKGYTDGCIESLRDAASKEDIPYTVNGDKVTPELKKGRTYKVILTDDCTATFVIKGEAQPETVKTLNIVTGKETVMNVALGDLKYIPVSQVSDLNGQIFDGLFNVTVNGTAGTSGENKSAGTFTYTGNDLEVGDKIAIYEGVRPDKRDLNTVDSDEDGGIAYVTITEKKGTTYGFVGTDAQDVLFTPDVLPISAAADTDGDADNDEITVDVTAVDFSGEQFSQLGLNATTTIDKGDFIALYEGGLSDGKVTFYGRIDSTEVYNGMITIRYTKVTVDEVLSSMDIYSKRNAPIDLTEEEAAVIAADIEKQAMESGFVDDAAQYLTALAIETNGFRELSADLDLDLDSYNIRTADGTRMSADDVMQLMESGMGVEITGKNVRAAVIPGYGMKHFEDAFGVRVELVASFTAVIAGEDKKNRVEINFEASFVEEVMLDITTSGGAIWKWALFIPYIDDYELSASIDIGTFACVGITATAKTVAKKEEPFDWKSVSGSKAEGAILDIGKQITDLMEEEQKFFGEKRVDENGEDIDAPNNGGGLADKYAAFIENANKSWIKLVEKEIFSTEGFVDPLHVLCYGVKLDFVVKANLYITMGITVETGEANRYLFSVRVFSRRAENDTINLEKNHFNVDLYVFGTAGLRVGLELELGVGLFSLKLDSVGVTAEAGVYAQFWGYFYMHYTKEEGEDADYSISGALLFEIGAYLEIKFKAQLFSSEDLTYEPTLFEKEWPFFTLGQVENVYDFDIEKDDEDLTMEIQCETVIPIWSEFFDMKYLDLKSGEEDTKSYDTDDEKNFTVRISNKKFSYNPYTNLITLNPGGSDHESCEITFIWKGCPLAFTSSAIERKVKIEWTDPLNMRYITFDAMGGSKVKSIIAASDTDISAKAPANPTKRGYVFNGWYTDKNYKTKWTCPTKMPSYENEGGGIVVYAKWSPATDTPYKVEHYTEAMNGGYVLADTVSYTGTTDTTPDTKSLVKDYTGFEMKTSAMTSIRPDGTSVMKIYYNRVKYTVSFEYGEREDGTENTQPIAYTVKYGSSVCVPNLYVRGYDFNGYKSFTPSADGTLVVTKNQTFTALWSASENTEYMILQYVQNERGTGYDLKESNTYTGVTEADIDIDSFKYTEARLIFKEARLNDEVITKAAIGADGNTVICLYYDRKTFTLTFINEGATVGEPETLAWGMEFRTPGNMEKQGYVFGGWYTDETCTEANRYDTSRAIMPEADLTLYAGWKPAEGTAYKVEYYQQNAEDDNYVKAGTDTFYGVTLAEATAVYKDFAHFTKNTTHADRVESGVIAADGSLVLKLYYDRDTVTVAFDANGGTLGADGASKTFRYGQTFEVTAPTRGEDFAFTGWYIGEDKFEDTTVTAEEDFTLTAKWLAGQVNYTVEHYLMGFDGTFSATPDFTDNTLFGEAEETLTLADLADSRYIVEGGIAFDRAEVGGETATTAMLVKGMTVKLYYTRSSYTLAWYPGKANPKDDDYTKAGTVYYGTPLVPPTLDTAYLGYTYVWDNLEETMPAKDLSVTTTWSPITYTVKFNANGGTGSMEDQVFTFDESQNLKSLGFTRNGYAFCGWSRNSDGNPIEYQDQSSAINMSYDDGTEITLYAVWEPAKYNITWVVGELNTPLVKQYTFGTGLTLPESDKDGYTLYGWSLKEDGSELISEIPATMYGDITLYAIYKKNVYVVNFDVNGGNDYENADDTRLTGSFGDTIEAPADPTKEATAQYSYEFAGWYTKAEGGTPISNFGTMKDTGVQEDNTWTVTYYAHWTPVVNVYVVTWNNEDRMSANDVYYTSGEFTCKDKLAVEYGEAIIAPPAITDDEDAQYVYTLLGWYTNCEKDSNGRYQTTEDSVKLTNSTTVTEDVTYYAVWKYDIKSYEIAWDLNQGTELTGTYTGDDGNAVVYGTVIVAPTAVKDSDYRYDYIFDGWYTAVTGGTKVTDFGTVTGEATYYAHWTTRYHEYSVTFTEPAKNFNETFIMTFDATAAGIPSTNLSAINTFTANTTNRTGFELGILGWYMEKSDGTYEKLDSDLSKFVLKQGMDDEITIVADRAYAIYVGGKQVTSLNAPDLNGDETISFVPSTNTLNLTDATITDGKDDSNTAHGPIEATFQGSETSNRALTLNISGLVTIVHTGTGVSNATGIFVDKASVIVDGTGEMKVTVNALVSGGTTIGIKADGYGYFQEGARVTLMVGNAVDWDTLSLGSKDSRIWNGDGSSDSYGIYVGTADVVLDKGAFFGFTAPSHNGAVVYTNCFRVTDQNVAFNLMGHSTILNTSKSSGTFAAPNLVLYYADAKATNYSKTGVSGEGVDMTLMNSVTVSTASKQLTRNSANLTESMSSDLDWLDSLNVLRFE